MPLLPLGQGGRNTSLHVHPLGGGGGARPRQAPRRVAAKQAVAVGRTPQPATGGKPYPRITKEEKRSFADDEDKDSEESSFSGGE